ncbi:histone-lysine N-methyltransferase SETD1A isoform X1 [Conger conger]|uniref:histone-lysine N-methyltransferase SETD1A isoform X1 n=1 Tax=Conger conger TaxID=82655 RepID=UPI002A59CE7B|nr:histone-lysine N-methyltransferase SETD1A isoform X1 [Conger conger]
MMKTLTKKLRRHSLNEIHPFQLKISYHGGEEGWESEDSEGENQELAQIDRERRRNSGLTPLATSQQYNQGGLSPARLRRLRVLLDPALDRHSSEEELERIIREDRRWAEQRSNSNSNSSASSDEEVKDLCGPPSAPAEPGPRLAPAPSPVPFSASPPHHGLLPPPRGAPARPLLLGHFDPPAAPYRRHRPGYGTEQRRPSLDLEKMQQKMLLKKTGGGKTRTIKIRNLSGSRPPPRYAYDPSVFAFRSLSTIPPRSPRTPQEELA